MLKNKVEKYPENETNSSILDEISRRGFIKVSVCAAAGLAALRAAPALAQDFKQLIIMEKSAGMIVADPSLCVGCQRCELACTEFNDGKADPKLARIKIGRNIHYGLTGAGGYSGKGFYGNSMVMQDTCRQCPHPVPCSTACPHNAIIAQPGTGTRIVDQNKCVGCRTCQKACPWGMMSFNEEKGKSDKCFLCNGKPRCVEACPAQALRYVPWSDRTKTDAARGSYMVPVPPDKAAACRACHVEAPGGPRNLKFQE